MKIKPSLIVLILSVAVMGLVAMWYGFNEVATAAVAGLTASLAKLVEAQD